MVLSSAITDATRQPNPLKNSPNTGLPLIPFSIGPPSIISFSLFPKALSTIYKDGELSIPTYEGEDYDLTSVSRPYNTKSFYMIALDDLHDKFIGVLAIAFNEEYKLTKEDWIFIRQKAGVVGTLLDNYLNTKK